MHSRRLFLQSTAAWAVAGMALRPAFSAEGDLIVRSADPYNAEPSLADLVKQWITPVKHFYVRNHGAMPKVDAAGLRVRVEGMVEKPLELALDQIKDRYQQQSVEATLVCGGNRRQELSAIKPVSGVSWDAGAIGNGRWTGARLSEVLKAAGIKSGAKHVWFDGLDPIKEKDGSVAPFGGSIPLEKAMADDVPALIAHAMNDQPLTAEHGAPLRAIVPGYIGARSVKWLTKITVSDRPSPNHFVAEAYKIVKTEDKSELAAANPIYEFGINAAICSPAPGKRMGAGRTKLRGYALASGGPGTTISKIEVSADGGRNWTRAQIDGENRPYAWCLWSADVDLPSGKHTLIARATDSRGRTMPERGEWNLKGYMFNGWHRVTVEAT